MTLKSKIASYEKWFIPMTFLGPALLGIFVFKIYPLFMGLYDSFFQYSFLNKEYYFAGLSNYVEAFTDPVFINSLKVTGIFNLIVNPLQVLLSFGLALLLMIKLPGKRTFRTLHLIPITVSFTIACVLWGVLLNPEQGLINSLLAMFGIDSQPFLYSKDQALASIIGIASWKGIGYWALFFIAGLEEVPDNLYEAASIDGANRLTTLWRITLPQMKRTIMFVVISDTVSNFLQFTPAYILTNGGPEGSTDLMMFQIFKNAYSYSNVNLASAMVIILLVILLVVVGIESVLLGSREGK
ncbi:MAG: sugar ABC transporter permease [Angelakisella sp.]|nr:sugar ABC transporter permease [Angelakisella sp.]